MSRPSFCVGGPGCGLSWAATCRNRERSHDEVLAEQPIFHRHHRHCRRDRRLCRTRLRPGPAAGTAAAQEGQGDQAIVVTGSRIRRDPLDQDNPVVFVDRDAIDRTGLTSVAEVLQRLPSAGGALNSRFNNSGNFGNPPDGGGVGAGASEVDLRYLGSQRTLVLLDGLRYVNGASASGVPGSIDLNTIPEGMIERVEVLQSGASSIYGSDAIAGVVNIITRRDQDGFLGSAQLGINRRGRWLHPELPAELGVRKHGQRHVDRRRRQLHQAGGCQLGRAAKYRNSRPRARPPATRPAARARPTAASSFSAHRLI